MKCTATSLYADGSDAVDVHDAHDANRYDDVQGQEGEHLPQVVDELSATHPAERF